MGRRRLTLLLAFLCLGLTANVPWTHRMNRDFVFNFALFDTDMETAGAIAAGCSSTQSDNESLSSPATNQCYPGGRALIIKKFGVSMGANISTTGDCHINLRINNVSQSWSLIEIGAGPIDNATCTGDNLIDTGATGIETAADSCIVSDPTGGINQRSALYQVESKDGTDAGDIACDRVNGAYFTIWGRWAA